ncbi:carboxypeptidase-like regulatory domain-containing protein [Pedobacter sp. NJ-S-72]
MKFSISIIFLFFFFRAEAQIIQVKGLITDKSTGQPVHGVTIGFEHTSIKTASDTKGMYSLLSKNKVKHIIFHSIGYHKLRLEIPFGEIHQMDIQLEPNSQDLSEVSISVAHKPRYKNKDNPAVELIRRVIEHKKSNAANLQNYLSYQEYEKN